MSANSGMSVYEALRCSSRISAASLIWLVDAGQPRFRGSGVGAWLALVLPAGVLCTMLAIASGSSFLSILAILERKTRLVVLGVS